VKNIAVILSGCGYLDGSEIRESILTLLAIDKAKATYQCIAPNIPQTQVVNHHSHIPVGEQRNVLFEAARLARGDIDDIDSADPCEFDIAILPGGIGITTNLSDFNDKGNRCSINAKVFNFLERFARVHKPIGFISNAAAIAPIIYGDNLRLALAHGQQEIHAIETMGGQNIECPVTDIIVDAKLKALSTPAHLSSSNLAEVEKGIFKLVSRAIELSDM